MRRALVEVGKSIKNVVGENKEVNIYELETDFMEHILDYGCNYCCDGVANNLNH